MRNHIFIPDQLHNLQDRGYQSTVCKTLGILQILLEGSTKTELFSYQNIICPKKNVVFFPMLTFERRVQNQQWATAIPLLHNVPQRTEDKYSKKDRYTYVPSNTISNS